MPDPADLIHELTLEGAALTLFHPGGDSPTFVIASEIALTETALVYFVVGETITGNVHQLEFDRMISPNPKAVSFYRGGQWIAYLTLVAEHDEEAVAAWAAWRQWLAEHPDAPEEIAVEISSIIGEGN